MAQNFIVTLRPLLQRNMSGVKARTWIKVKDFVGLPKRDDFEIVEKELPALKDGGKKPKEIAQTNTVILQ